MAATMTEPEPIQFKDPNRKPRPIPPICLAHGEPIAMIVNGGDILNAEGKYLRRYICPVLGCEHRVKRVVTRREPRPLPATEQTDQLTLGFGDE